MTLTLVAGLRKRTGPPYIRKEREKLMNTSPGNSKREGREREWREVHFRSMTDALVKPAGRDLCNVGPVPLFTSDDTIG